MARLTLCSLRKRTILQLSSSMKTWSPQCWTSSWQERKPPAPPSYMPSVCWSNTQTYRVGPWMEDRVILLNQFYKKCLFLFCTEKMQKEIDSVIRQGCGPSMENRKSLPFTDAVIHEVQRFLDIVPFSLPHYALHDISFRGFTIPKVLAIPRYNIH